MKSAIITLLLAILLLSIMSATSCSRWYNFKSNCGDYLKLAADAPTPHLAAQFLEHAVSYIDSHGLVSGNSSLVFVTPKNDLSIWSSQVHNAHAIAIEVDRPEATQLERTNALMKIRETLLDQGKEGVYVTTPDNISWYPQQWLFTLGWIAVVAFLVAGVVAIVVVM